MTLCHNFLAMTQISKKNQEELNKWYVIMDYKIHTDQVKHPYKYRVVFTNDCDYED